MDAPDSRSGVAPPAQMWPNLDKAGAARAAALSQLREAPGGARGLTDRSQIAFRPPNGAAALAQATSQRAVCGIGTWRVASGLRHWEGGSLRQ